MHLRKWQQAIIDNFPSIIKQHKRFILKAPTGAGKTVLASEIIERFYKGKNIVVLCHRLVLLEQLERALSKKHRVRKLEVSDAGNAFADHDILLSTSMRAKAMLADAIPKADLINEVKAQGITPGKRMEGARMLIVYPTLLGAAGATTTAIKDIMLGRQDALDPEKFDDKFVENILKVVGANKYMLDQMASGRTGGGDFVVDLISPPAVGMLNAFTNIVSAAGDPEELEKDVNYAMSYAPMLGRFWYNFYGGGLERYEEGLWEGGRGLSLDIMGNN